jgi:hypothetical protein
MSYNMMIGYDIYDRFTVEHFPLRQSMILRNSFFARESGCIQILDFGKLNFKVSKLKIQILALSSKK